MKTNAVFSTGFGAVARSRFAGLAMAFAMMLAGCRGCSDEASLDDEVEVQAKKTESRALRRERRMSSRADLKKLRALTLRAPSAEESDHELASAIEEARALIEQSDAELAREALVDLAAWLAEHPDDLDALYWSGRARVVTLEYDQAIELFKSALKVDDTYVLPYRWVVYALGERQRFSDALPMAALAVKLAPADPDVYVDRALCGLRSGNFDTMEADFEKACSLGDTEICDVAAAARMVAERRKGGKAKRAAKGGKSDARKQKLGKGKSKGKKGSKLGVGMGIGADRRVGKGKLGKGKGKGKGKGRKAAQRKRQEGAEGTASTTE